MKTILPIIFFLTTSLTLLAQKTKSELFVGYKIDIGYNIYQWQEKGAAANKRSYGQIFNVVPIVGTGVWLGKENWNLSLEGAVNYAPFSLDLQKYSGAGAVAFPVLLKGAYVIPGVRGIGGILRLGAGLQWQSSEWYLRPKGLAKEALYFDRSYIGEISVGLITGDFRRSHVWSFELFGLVGGSGGLQRQWGVYTGIRLCYWSTFRSYNPSRSKI